MAAASSSGGADCSAAPATAALSQQLEQQVVLASARDGEGAGQSGPAGCSSALPFSFLILDCDGVMVDSERSSCEALRQAILQVWRAGGQPLLAQGAGPPALLSRSDSRSPGADCQSHSFPPWLRPARSPALTFPISSLWTTSRYLAWMCCTAWSTTSTASTGGWVGT